MYINLPIKSHANRHKHATIALNNKLAFFKTINTYRQNCNGFLNFFMNFPKKIKNTVFPQELILAWAMGF